MGEEAGLIMACTCSKDLCYLKHSHFDLRVQYYHTPELLLSTIATEKLLLLHIFRTVANIGIAMLAKSTMTLLLLILLRISVIYCY